LTKKKLNISFNCSTKRDVKQNNEDRPHQQQCSNFKLALEFPFLFKIAECNQSHVMITKTGINPFLKHAVSGLPNQACHFFVLHSSLEDQSASALLLRQPTKRKSFWVLVAYEPHISKDFYAFALPRHVILIHCSIRLPWTWTHSYSPWFLTEKKGFILFLFFDELTISPIRKTFISHYTFKWVVKEAKNQSLKTMITSPSMTSAPKYYLQSKFPHGNLKKKSPHWFCFFQERMLTLDSYSCLSCDLLITVTKGKQENEDEEGIPEDYKKKIMWMVMSGVN